MILSGAWQKRDTLVLLTPSASLTAHHLPTKGDDMAVSKHTRRSISDTNQRIQKLFRRLKIADGREQAWRVAVQFAETGTPSLRFPVYEQLYSLNIYSQRLVDLVKEITGKFAIHPEKSLYHQSMIQQVRAGVTSDILAHMNGVEVTEEWLFESLRWEEEKGFRDPDDVYFEVREREQERIKKGLPPRIRFLDEEAVRKNRTTTINKSN
jgi:hypothetical protein